MNIYIELEVYNREIESKILLAINSLKKGLKVFIGQRSVIHEMALAGNLVPGIIHMKDVYGGFDVYTKNRREIINIIKNLKKKNFFFTAQDEELGIMSENFREFSKLRFNNLSVFKNLIYYFCVGSRDFKYLNSKCKGNTLVKSGTPRFDILRLKSKNNYKKKSQIAIICNFNIFGQNNLSDRIFDSLNHKESNFLKEKTIYQKEKMQIEKVYEFIQLARFLAISFPKKKILVRPHPKDNFENWKKILGRKNKNLLLDFKTSLSETILDSEYIIQNGCTSSIESFFLNSKCISYHPNKWPDIRGDIHGKFANKLCINANTKKDVKEIIKKRLNTKKKNLLNHLEKRIYLNNKNAYEIIINSWNKIFDNNEILLNKENNVNKILLFNNIKSLIKKILLIKETHKDNTFPKFEKKHLYQIISKIKNDLNLKDEIRIKKLNNKLIYLEIVK
tara:strand:- start:7596 stop:8939 length:1344 start_codon:yes stop_codon:yes gene_type:complete